MEYFINTNDYICFWRIFYFSIIISLEKLHLQSAINNTSPILLIILVVALAKDRAGTCCILLDDYFPTLSHLFLTDLSFILNSKFIWNSFKNYNKILSYLIWGIGCPDRTLYLFREFVRDRIHRTLIINQMAVILTA